MIKNGKYTCVISPKRLKDYKDSCGMSYRDMEDATGVSSTALLRYIKGQGRISSSNMLKIVNYMGYYGFYTDERSIKYISI